MNLIEIFSKFQNNEEAVRFLEQKRWGDKVICVYCNSNKTCRHKEQNKTRWQCWNCKKSFNVTVGTIFHHTYIQLNKWFMLIGLMLNAKKGLSACQASRDLGMRRATIWSMMHRIRKAMMTDEAKLLSGIVEMDECYIGGKPRKENIRDDDDNKPDNPRGRGTKKALVVGMCQREGDVKAQTAEKTEIKANNLQKIVNKSVDINNSSLITDDYKGYSNMSKLLNHSVINHNKQYVNKSIHTNTIESFWAMLKRGIIGQFHWVSKKYLQSYLYEFEYKYNCRRDKNNVNFDKLLWRMIFAK